MSTLPKQSFTQTPLSDLIDSPSPELSLDLSASQRAVILQERVIECSAVPSLHVDTCKYRRGPSSQAKADFRTQLLHDLRQNWQDKTTEARFLELAHLLENQGCAFLTGLIGHSCFTRLIAKYEEVQERSGNGTFLHSYVNLADIPTFLTDAQYNGAFAHPLLIALIAYCMGGAIRITDVRGKDTNPIAIKAQDNMLHADNTPFRDEYKVLLCWEKGVASGPDGQNFTCLPGTHKGNRDILLDGTGQPWSTERDSLFISDEAIDGLFTFQEQVTGRPPMVIEAVHPERPISIVFTAGALVHHRYRSEQGKSRSCIIAAFHLSSENPGALVGDTSAESHSKSLMDVLIGPLGANSDFRFVTTLAAEAPDIEAKISEIFQSSHSSSILIDTASLALKDEQLSQWRESVVNSPSTSSVKLARNVRLSGAKLSETESLTERLASVMTYDKHGLLQLILYEDGHEEVRKPARMRIREMEREAIVSRLVGWVPEIMIPTFSARDLPKPKELREMLDVLVKLADARIELDRSRMERTVGVRHLISLKQLAIDMGESITRCDSIETFVSTSLFMFWISDGIISLLEQCEKQKAVQIGTTFLRNYIASVLLIESM